MTTRKSARQRRLAEAGLCPATIDAERQRNAVYALRVLRSLASRESPPNTRQMRVCAQRLREMGEQ